MRTFSAKREVALGLASYGLYLLVRWRALRGDGRERSRRNAERVVELRRGSEWRSSPQCSVLCSGIPGSSTGSMSGMRSST